MALPSVMGLIAVGGLGLGLIRITVMAWLIGRRSTPASGRLQSLANCLAAKLGAPPARVLLSSYQGPLAFTYGWLTPGILLSTRMLEDLDEKETEAVLAHELAHVVRRDYLTMWLATMLRDAFFYFPTSWIAYRQLQREKELASDDLAATHTGRPLALASALARTWQKSLAQAPLGLGQPLVGLGQDMEGRVKRLLNASSVAVSDPRSRLLTLGLAGLAFAGLVGIQAVNLAAMLAPMGCGPLVMLGNAL
ncbi:MAG: M56 family metallopeptidase [Chloroflexi bacterium]|nr:M56 family metallopeptidase [Chloroflexota bacterium]